MSIIRPDASSGICPTYLPTLMLEYNSEKDTCDFVTTKVQVAINIFSMYLNTYPMCYSKTILKIYPRKTNFLEIMFN